MNEQTIHKIRVTQEHLDAAQAGHPTLCAISRAVNDHFEYQGDEELFNNPSAPGWAYTTNDMIQVKEPKPWQTPTSCDYQNSKAVQEIIGDYDDGLPVKPFTLILQRKTVSRQGRATKNRPSNAKQSLPGERQES